MFKLLKYEFRKALTSLLILLGLTVALEGYFLGSFYLEESTHLVFSITLLMICTYAVAIYVFVRGVTTYSAEMKSRSAYLIFMTPNSGLKIMASKFLYTFVNGLLFAVVYATLAVLDVGIVLKELGEYENFIASFSEFLREYGIRLDQIGLGAMVVIVNLFLSSLSFFAVAYLAITLSHTLFRDKKWRGVAAVGLFFLLNWGISELNGLLPSPMNALIVYENTMTMGITDKFGLAPAFNDILLAMLPTMGVSLATILVSLFGCAWMLDKKVSL